MQNHIAGKFCGSCAKAVIDFTKLSDNEIIRILENANGKSLCGRFDSVQLNKIMVQTNAERNNPVLYKMLAGLLLLASVETASAQIAPKEVDSISVSESHTSIIGKVIRSNPVNGTEKDNFLETNDSARIVIGRMSPHVVVNKPLFIVDGIIVDEDVLRLINQDHIKSFNVLKGADAISVYGERGKSGVIIINLYSNKEIKKRKQQK